MKTINSAIQHFRKTDAFNCVMRVCAGMMCFAQTEYILCTAGV